MSADARLLVLFGLLVASGGSWLTVLVYAISVGALVGWKNLGGQES